jgi:hypothetical protein
LHKLTSHSSSEEVNEDFTNAGEFGSWVGRVISYLPSCTDQIMADPSFWSYVIEGLPTLTPGTYIHGECIDFNLRTYWMKEKSHAFMWFLHLEGVRSFQMQQGPDEDELRHLRQQLCIPEENVEDRPVVLVVHFVDHYFVVVGDYESGVMYVFGRHVSADLAGVSVQDDKDWRAWRGHFLWIHLPKLFGWKRTSAEPSVIFAINWEQVGDFHLLK